ncbi:hypothetical protein EV702DRAFT_1048888 [Suillus placidus]|uniref:Uncharacterized protein n=1 Tax=Suillus placidus TaxID=48579 RepID=A0A9P7CYL8_9AGAM|nr:hypothetical protein EV702DRAFT_1048888 [Suillus placidus]
MMNGLQSLTQWNQAFSYPTGGTQANYDIGLRGRLTVGRSQNIGALSAYPFAPYMAHDMGRRVPIIFGASLMFIGARFLAPWKCHVRYPEQLDVENSFCTLRNVTGSTLCVKGRACAPSLAYYHANGNAQDPLVQHRLEEIKAAIAFDREVVGNLGWLSFIKTPGNRKRLRFAIAVFSQRPRGGLIAYYLNTVLIATGITNPKTQLLLNGALNTYDFFVTILLPPLTAPVWVDAHCSRSAVVLEHIDITG